MSGLTKERTLAPGDVLFEEGEQGEFMYIIARGAVAVSRERHDTPTTLDVLGSGDILGEISLLTGEPRSATARAETSVILGEIPRAGFETLLASDPVIRERVWSQLASRRFEDHVVDHPMIQQLSRADRSEWLQSGDIHVLALGDEIVMPMNGYAFVIVGAVEQPGRQFRAPVLFELRAGESIRATKVSRVAILPDRISSGVGY